MGEIRQKFRAGAASFVCCVYKHFMVTSEGRKHWKDFVNEMIDRRTAWCEDGYTAIVTSDTEEELPETD